MCTAISYRTKDHYFGRNLDLEGTLGEMVTITPRNYPLSFRKLNSLNDHYAIIGMACVWDGYPLYYDATNEKGLSMAGLNFPGLASYHPEITGKDNVTPFEFIPWILGQCDCIPQVKQLLQNINLLDTPFLRELPLSPLHWMISDREQSLVVEPMDDGLHIHDNPVGVLTNNPPFDYHMYHLADYMNLSPHPAQNSFSVEPELKAYSRGMGAMGLPGDLSSASRFVKAAFVKLNSVCGDSEQESVNQFFHILGSVCQQRGPVRIKEQLYEYTQYSSCCNTDKGIYYYTTYDNNRISAVDLRNENLNGNQLISYPLLRDPSIYFQN